VTVFADVIQTFLAFLPRHRAASFMIGGGRVKLEAAFPDRG